LAAVAADGHAAMAAAPVGVAAEAFSALVALGYRPNEATRAQERRSGGSTEE
jgi:Holliday junction resolvasome RuvABC DNA-binding subunit